MFDIDNEETNGLTCFEPEHPSSLVLVSQVFEEEPLNYQHQGPRLETRRPLDNDLSPIFDEEDELDPIFDEEAPSTSSIIIEKHLCFDPGTTSTPLPKKHCEKLYLLNSLPEMFVKISSPVVNRFGFDKVKEFCVSNSVFDNMIHSSEKFELDGILDQKRFQNGNDIHFGFVLSLDQFLKHSKSFDHLEKSFELDLQQSDFCVRKSFDSSVFKENDFNLSPYRHELITGNLFASTCALDEFLVKKLLKQKSHRAETDFIFDSVLKLDNLCVETDKPWHNLKPMFENCVVLSFDVILVYNTFFDDYPKSLDHVLDVLRIEKLFDYFSRRFDVVSLVVLKVQDKYDQFPRRENTGEHQSSYVSGTWNWKYLRKTSPKLQGTFCPYFSFIEFYMILKFVISYSFPFDKGEMDLRSNPFQEGGNDVPWGSAPGKTGMHGLIMESSKDICSLFDSYLPNHEASTHKITWRMFSTQLRSSLKKNQIKRSSYVIVMLFTNQVIFSYREFRPPEKLEMANLLSDEPTVNSIMTKVIIHVLNVQESLGLDGLQKRIKNRLV